LVEEGDIPDAKSTEISKRKYKELMGIEIQRRKDIVS
jgi:hypothetical protein